jgi:Tfp pilus assembly protein PilW
MECKTTPVTERGRRRRRTGALLSEYLISIGLGTIVALVLVTLTVYSGRSFAGLANYLDLNAKGMLAMDTITRDVRRSAGLTSYSTNQLVFADSTNATGLVFTYDPASRTLVRRRGANSSTLLTGCDSLQFSIYQSTPLAGTYDQYPTASGADCKVLSIRWTCSRTILGVKATTETDEEAKVVIRNP